MSAHSSHPNYVLIFIQSVFRVLCQSVEVLIRERIGERYLNPINIIFSTVLLIFLITFTYSFTVMFNSFWMWLFVAVSFTATIIHVVLARKRHKQNIEVHTYYTGSPLLRYEWSQFSESTIKLYLEPLVLFTGGFVLFVIGRYLIYGFYGLGFFLMLMSILLFIKAQIDFVVSRTQYLDAYDKKIEAEHLTSALRNKGNAADQKGFHIPGYKVSQPEVRESIKEMYQNLDPTLQKMMTQNKEPMREKGATKHIVETKNKTRNKGMERD